MVLSNRTLVPPRSVPTGPQTQTMATASHMTPLAGDMSRRVARRRAELGLTIEQLGGQTGINPATSDISRPTRTHG